MTLCDAKSKKYIALQMGADDMLICARRLESELKQNNELMAIKGEKETRQSQDLELQATQLPRTASISSAATR